MLIDKQNQFSADAGDSPTVVGTTDSTNIIDLAVTRDIGSAQTDFILLMAQVVTAFTSGGSATLQVIIKAAPDSSNVPGTYFILSQSDAVPVASLVAGYKFLAGEIPSANAAYRFLKISYVIGTAVMTAGTIKTALVPALDASPSYQRGYVA